MSKENMILKQQAEEFKALYKTNAITRQEAQAGILPYVEAFNTKSKEIAKKFGMRAKTISFASFIR